MLNITIEELKEIINNDLSYNLFNDNREIDNRIKESIVNGIISGVIKKIIIE